MFGRRRVVLSIDESPPTSLASQSKDVGLDLRFASGLALFHGVKCHNANATLQRATLQRVTLKGITFASECRLVIVAVHSVNERCFRAKRQKQYSAPQRINRNKQPRQSSYHLLNHLLNHLPTTKNRGKTQT